MSLDPRPKFPTQLQLKDLIRQVKAELSAAAKESIDGQEAPMFELAGVTLEINFVIENEQSAEGGFKAKLLAIVSANVGAKVTYSSEQVHKVTVQLLPCVEDKPTKMSPPSAGQSEPPPAAAGSVGGGSGGRRGIRFIRKPDEDEQR
jgi:hypothetical protein